MALCTEAGITVVQVTTRDGAARFPSVESRMYTDVRGWTLSDMIDDEDYALLLDEAKRALSRFVADDGTVAFRALAHIVTAVKAS